jgi:hypothetical protein
VFTELFYGEGIVRTAPKILKNANGLPFFTIHITLWLELTVKQIDANISVVVYTY